MLMHEPMTDALSVMMEKRRGGHRGSRKLRASLRHALWSTVSPRRTPTATARRNRRNMLSPCSSAFVGNYGEAQRV